MATASRPEMPATKRSLAKIEGSAYVSKMSVVARAFPPSLPHGEIREVLPGMHLVSGTVGMPGPLPIRFSRNMTILKEGERLVLVNTVRLDAEGLAALDKLGKVTDVIRLAGNHGQDDPFYADRYKAKTWVVKGQRYTAGFDTNAKDTYFTPDVEMDESTVLPVKGARLYFFRSQPPEALLLIAREGGVCVSGTASSTGRRPTSTSAFSAA
jgi:hypothetical protein